MKYYVAIKRNTVFIHAIVGMNFENTVPSERSQSQRTL